MSVFTMDVTHSRRRGARLWPCYSNESLVIKAVIVKNRYFASFELYVEISTRDTIARIHRFDRLVSIIYIEFHTDL